MYDITRVDNNLNRNKITYYLKDNDRGGNE